MIILPHPRSKIRNSIIVSNDIFNNLDNYQTITFNNGTYGIVLKSVMDKYITDDNFTITSIPFVCNYLLKNLYLVINNKFYSNNRFKRTFIINGGMDIDMIGTYFTITFKVFNKSLMNDAVKIMKTLIERSFGEIINIEKDDNMVMLRFTLLNKSLACKKIDLTPKIRLKLEKKWSLIVSANYTILNI